MMGQTPSRNEPGYQILDGQEPDGEERNLFDFFIEPDESERTSREIPGERQGRSISSGNIANRNTLAYRLTLNRIHRNFLQFARQPSTHRPQLESVRHQFKRSQIREPDDKYVEFFDADLGYPDKLRAILKAGLPDRKVMIDHAWNPEDRSENIALKEDDPLTLHRHPVAQSTDCIRGKIGYKRGFHVWQIIWPIRQRGTHAVIGVATKNARLRSPGYTSLIGSTVDSYGWDIVRLKCSHDAKSNRTNWDYPSDGWDSHMRIEESYSVPESIYCILDMDEGYMAFATDEEYLGVAFRGLRGLELFPVVSAVWGHCEITIKYLGGIPPEAPSLLSTCRRAICNHFGKKNLHKILDLNLPTSCVEYLMLK